MENSIIKVICPCCQQRLAFKRPEKSNGVAITCPKCKKQLRIKITPTNNMAEMQMAHLVMIGGPQTTKLSYPLHKGSNIIGRSDIDTVQDIAITGDMTISRSSIELDVISQTGGGYSYMLKVLNAKNPVYVNNIPLRIGNSLALRIGDTLELGTTKLMLNINNNKE